MHRLESVNSISEGLDTNNRGVRINRAREQRKLTVVGTHVNNGGELRAERDSPMLHSRGDAESRSTAP